MLRDLFTHKRKQAASGNAGSLSGRFVPLRAQQERCAQRCLTERFLMHATRVTIAILFFTASALCAFNSLANAATITNAAWLYSGTQLLSQDSVSVTSTERTPATLTFYVYRPGSSLKQDILTQPTEYHPAGTPADSFELLPPPDFYGTSLPLDEPLPLVNTGNLSIHTGEPLFMTLEDGDQNRDPAVMETVLVTINSNESGDTEQLRLTETGPDTGVFSGYLMTDNNHGSSGDGLLEVIINDRIDGFYIDVDDQTDTSADTLLVDPFGIVFDSLSGEPVDGVKVTLYDVTNNQPTDDIRDDLGQLGYPHTVLTGDADLGFPPGGFRFPLIEAGRDYRLDIEPVSTYSDPSTVPPAELRDRFPQFEIDDTASYGGSFFVNPGPAINIDVPLDPATGPLWIRKSADRDEVAIGDYLRYTLTLDNSSSGAATGELRIADHLPLGFRYQSGSLRIDNLRAAEPTIDRNARSMEITVDNLEAGKTLAITYVVEISSGAKLGKAINYAVVADSDGESSNTAQARVFVRDIFFENSTFLLGRVMIGSCDDPDTEKAGLANVRIYLEDGSYVDTDENGNYHFEGVEPGVHVVQVDTMSLPQNHEMLPCEESSQSAGRSFSQFVDLQGGTLWRVDFHSAPKQVPSGEVALTLSAELEQKIADFTATVATRTVAVENPRLTVMLPGGFSYLPGTAAHNGQPIEDPELAAGGLSFELPDMAANQTTLVTFRAQLEGTPESGELPTKAALSFNTATGQSLRTPTAETRFRSTPGEPAQNNEIKLYPNFPSLVAELQPTDLVMLEQLASALKFQKIVRLDIVGHTDSQKIAPRSRHIQADNQALSEARAQSVATLLQQQLALPEGVVTIRGMAQTMPVADNTTATGRALNRRVEVYLVAEAVPQEGSLSVAVPTSPEQTVAISATREESHASRVEENLAEASKELPIGLLSPTDGRAVNRIEAVRVRLDSNLKPRLTVDGIEIAKDRIGFRMLEPESKTTLYSYIGVDFGEPGTHKLKIEGIGPFGNARFSEVAEIVRTGAVTIIRLLEVADNLADGRTPVRIRVELIDEFGRQLQNATSLGLEDGSLKPLGMTTADEYDVLELDEQASVVTVDAQGWISFDPVNQSGYFPLKLVGRETVLETEIFVKPYMRDWILVGFAEGTAGYNNLSGNQVSLDEADIDEHYYEDGRVKFFAKGAIKGEWLLTMAYDSDKANLDGRKLHQIIDPDSYYPLYGDGTYQGYETSSAREIFIKLERDQFYAMFGDMNTNLNQTELSRYSRTMNGFKSEMQTYRFSYTMFAADTRQAFAKDEIPGDGTSGRYYLSSKNVVINSDQVVIETRDRLRNEIIISSENLNRYTDYDIDYASGSLYFKRPVPNRDDDFNPVFIVVRYETNSNSGKNLNYGGRAAVKLLNQKVEVGASYVHEEEGDAEGDLYGVDMTVDLTPRTSLHVEAATTDKSFYADDEQGDAYIAEIRHDTGGISSSAYFREIEGKFGLGQLNNNESDMRKYGAETRYIVNPKLSLAGLAYHEDNLSTGAKRDVATVDSSFNYQAYSLHAGLRYARDELSDGSSQQSNQLLTGVSWVAPRGKLRLYAEHEQSIGSNENNDFPTRLRLGADYKLSPIVSMFADHEFTWGDEDNTQSTRTGLRATPWQGGNIDTTLEQQTDENGQRVFALFGLGQTWRINQNWSASTTLERGQMVKSTSANRVNPNAAPAYGADDDFTAISIGSTYRKTKWSWWNRLETRQADREDTYGISTSVVAEPEDGIAVSARALAFISDVTDGVRRTDANLRMGMAYRPANSRWIILNRLDFYFDREDHSADEYDSWRIVNNLHANFRLNRKLQMSFYYGLKYVRDNYDGRSYSGYTDLIAFESRYNINKRWDVGVHGSMLHSWNSNTVAYSAGADIGYSPITNTWVSLGYNIVGFEDDDFANADYTAQGAYMRFRTKFDQQSVRDAAAWINK